MFMIIFNKTHDNVIQLFCVITGKHGQLCIFFLICDIIISHDPLLELPACLAYQHIPLISPSSHKIQILNIWWELRWTPIHYFKRIKFISHPLFPPSLCICSSLIANPLSVFTFSFWSFFFCPFPFWQFHQNAIR